MVDAPRPSQPAGGPDFDSWVAARGPALSRFAHVLTGSLEAADAVMQEALSTACLHWASMSADEQVDVRVQALAARAYLRGGARRAPAAARSDPSDPWLPAQPDLSTPDPEADQVWERCETLTPRQRAVLALCVHAGLDLAEVAESLRIRIGTAAAEVRAAVDTVLPGQPATHRARAGRVALALQQHADATPQPYAAASRAATRAARRRRRTRALTSVAAVAALALPAAWAVAAGDGPRRSPTSPAAPLARPAPVDVSDWRWESWGGVQVQVPPEWGHGDLTQWCVAGGPSGPAVDRPEQVSTEALCSVYDDDRPTYTGGLLLRRAEDSPRLSRADVAPYATARIHTVGEVTLTVVDISPAVGDAILASVEVVGRRDFNGCRPHYGRPGRSVPEPTGVPPSPARAGTVSVCRYGVDGWRRPTLISSRRLPETPADALVTALRAAPVVDAAGRSEGCGLPAAEFAVLEVWPADDGGSPARSPASVVVRYSGCAGHGVYDGHSVRGLTAGVLKATLAPPWDGRLAADVRRVLAGR